MNCTTDLAITTPQSKQLSREIDRLQSKLTQATGREQDKVLDQLLDLYRERAAAFDQGAE